MSLYIKGEWDKRNKKIVLASPLFIYLIVYTYLLYLVLLFITFLIDHHRFLLVYFLLLLPFLLNFSQVPPLLYLSLLHSFFMYFLQSSSFLIPLSFPVLFSISVCIFVIFSLMSFSWGFLSHFCSSFSRFSPFNDFFSILVFSFSRFLYLFTICSSFSPLPFLALCSFHISYFFSLSL